MQHHEHGMRKWPVAEELIVVGVIIAVSLAMALIGLLIGSTGMLLLSFTVGPAIGWVLGVMAMVAYDNRSDPEDETD